MEEKNSGVLRIRCDRFATRKTSLLIFFSSSIQKDAKWAAHNIKSVMFLRKEGIENVDLQGIGIGKRRQA
ncbi:MAG: hypothetical protein ACI4QT_03910 [Kiritimatiellia bacterium]